MIFVATLSNLKKGHHFDFKITCGINTFDIYVNDEKIHSFLDIHSNPDYTNPLIVTALDHEAKAFEVTDLHYTYCKFSNTFKQACKLL